MKSNPKYISIASQKGGIGKSTITTIVASFLHYTMGKNIAIIDCDYPQHSLCKLRERDLNTINKSEKHNRTAHLLYTTLKKENKKAYFIEGTTINNAMVVAMQLSATYSLDFIFFDLPGSVNEKQSDDDMDATLKFLIQMDYLFIPISADRLVFQSSSEFFLLSQAACKKYSQIANQNIETCFFWTRVDNRERTSLYDLYTTILQDNCHATILQNKIPSSVKFNKELVDTEEVLRCTLLPPSSSSIQASMMHFTNEILDIIKQ